MLYCRLNDLSVWSFFDFFWNGRWNEIFHRRFWQVITVCHSNLCYVIRMVVRLMCKLMCFLFVHNASVFPSLVMLQECF